MNATDKIKETAQRIARLGAYLASPYGPTARKVKGLLQMMRDPLNPTLLVCNLRDGRVWEYQIDDSDSAELSDGPALERLAVFERQITTAVERQLREEVLQDLVAKRIRRITKSSARGFKADLRRNGKRPE
jgi:hypothetical protein